MNDETTLQEDEISTEPTSEVAEPEEGDSDGMDTGGDSDSDDSESDSDGSDDSEA